MAYEFSGRWIITVVENGEEGYALILGISDNTQLATVGQNVTIDHSSWGIQLMRSDGVPTPYLDLREVFERPAGRVRILRGSSDPLFEDFTRDDPKIMVRCVDQDPVFNNPPYLGRRGLHYTLTELLRPDRRQRERPPEPRRAPPPPPDRPR